MTTAIVWFRNDLRVYEHPALAAAAQDFDRVIPVFILSHTLLEGKHASSNRNRFLLESLDDLTHSLQSLGADLVIRTGDPAAELLKLAGETGAETVHYTIDYTPYARSRDARVTETLSEHNIALHGFPGRLLIDSFKDLVTKTGQTYKVFTPFWKNWSLQTRRDIADTPTALKLPPNLPTGTLYKLKDVTCDADLSPDVVKGGETVGRERLHAYIKNDLEHYSERHNRLTPEGTSRLSPYLHFGCISVREIEELLPDSANAARFHRQLAWRDFYNYILFHFPENAEREFQERYRNLEWEENHDAYQAWKEGKTGFPIVDAAMRQLLREGWMHNRARLIVGSFLTKDLGLDWRLGERYFMQMLLDGDEANNNGNWQWISSVGVDPAPLFRRLYNPMTQQENHDPDGSYVRYYVPELAKVPDKYITDPSKMSGDEQKVAQCRIGYDYPAPIVNHAQARQATMERYGRAASSTVQDAV